MFNDVTKYIYKQNQYNKHKCKFHLIFLIVKYIKALPSLFAPMILSINLCILKTVSVINYYHIIEI